MGGQVPRGVRVGTLLLDTTYANARYTFPPQVCADSLMMLVCIASCM